MLIKNNSNYCSVMCVFIKNNSNYCSVMCVFIKNNSNYCSVMCVFIKNNSNYCSVMCVFIKNNSNYCSVKHLDSTTAKRSATRQERNQFRRNNLSLDLKREVLQRSKLLNSELNTLGP